MVAGIAFVMMVLGGLPKQVALAFLVGASVIMLLQTNRVEGFEMKAMDPEDKESPDKTGSPEETGEIEPVEEKHAKPEGFKPIKEPVVVPDNATRMEPLVLGKPYTLPSESDDKEFHLDAGTTFLNAYKALKPDQIAAMTKDTQELLATQKSLMAMLDSMKPLLSDGQNMMNMFGSYFGKDQ
jgi:hypothetical protein